MTTTPISPIPKIIHQTWKTSDVPEKWKKSPEEWKRLHPEWEYKLWTDNDNRNLIKDFFPDFLSIYDSFKYNIQRADMIRYFILYKYGGVYSDLDVYPCKNIEPYISSSSVFEHSSEECYLVYGANSKSHFTRSITNCFMVSKPKATIWLKVFDELQKGLPWYIFGKHFIVLCSTGPLMLDKVVREKADKTVGVLPRKLFTPTPYEQTISENEIVLKSLEGKSWNSFDSHILNMIDDNKLFFIGMGLLFIVFIIFGLIYYFVKFRRCSKSKGYYCEI